jgi:hypothetical protein
MKPFLIRLISLAVFFTLGKLAESVTWEFSLNRHLIASSLPFRAYGEFPPSLLGQTWTLKACGGQSYVFFSQDGSYVLKFFKDQPRPWLKWPAYLAQKNKKLHRTLTGYSLFQERCPSLSGVTCLHFQPTSYPLPATLIDRLGITSTIDLKSYLFVLQKKGIPLKAPVTSQEKQQLISAATDLLLALSCAHLKDHDPRFHLNLGYLDQKLIVMDPGRMAHSSEPAQQLPEKFYEFIK